MGICTIGSNFMDGSIIHVGTQPWVAKRNDLGLSKTTCWVPLISRSRSGANKAFPEAQREDLRASAVVAPDETPMAGGKLPGAKKVLAGINLISSSVLPTNILSYFVSSHLVPIEH